MSIKPYRRANNLAKVLAFEREMIEKEKRERIERDSRPSESGVEVVLQVHSNVALIEQSITKMWETYPELVVWKTKKEKEKRNPTPFII